ncbi:MAG: AI-2E family transporter [Inquilinaceae bacterium]
MAAIGLFVLAVFCVLYFARGLIMPIVLAILLSIVLRPLVRMLEKIRVPSHLGAAIVLIALVAIVVAGAYRLSEPAYDWVQRGPTVMRGLEDKLSGVRESLEEAQEVTQQLEDVAAVGADTDTTVVVAGPSLSRQIFDQAQTAFGGIFLILVLLYFLLAQGSDWLRGMVDSIQDPRRRKETAEAMANVETEISAYLRTVAVINFCLGMVTAAAMFALGMPNPLLWGVMVATLNFIPYLGAIISLGIITLVSIMTFDTPLQILLPPLVFLGLTSLEGHFITPTVVGRRLTLSPILVFFTVLLWGWLWGIPGALLAVPILATFKVLADHVSWLRPMRPLFSLRQSIARTRTPDPSPIPEEPVTKG